MDRRKPIRTASSADAPRRAPPIATRERRYQPSPLFVGSLEKGLRVLHAFDAARRPMRLAEVAAASELDKSAAQRFTATLERLGYLRKDEFKRYRLTPKVLQLGFAYLQSETSVDTVVPFLQEAHAASEESVNFTQLDDLDVVWVVRLPSLHVVSVDMSVGARLPAYCTAPGRAILAHLPEEQALDILRRSTRARLTPYTKTAISDIVAALAAARRDGVAVSDQECFVGDLSSAAPVFDGAGQVIGAVNIAVPTSRWTLDEVRERLSPLIAKTAAAISAAHGVRAKGVARQGRLAAGD
jgi:PcaR/PcaU/PobR family beta-ketoadipate pathway transcriptional regulator